MGDSARSLTRIFYLLAGIICGGVALSTQRESIPAAILAAGFFLGFAHLVAASPSPGERPPRLLD